jgi:trimeric autotransporter adhesin
MVDHIVVSAGLVYIMGRFEQAGGIAVKNVARWDGSPWSPRDSGVDTPATMAANQSGLYVTGDFAGSIALWDGSSFLPVPAIRSGIMPTRWLGIIATCTAQ